MSSFFKEFEERGYLYQATDWESLKQEEKNGKKFCAYIGFDCTAKSFHVGNLMQIMILRLFQNHGHKPIILLGGATTKIGDPTGKDEARKIVTEEELDANIKGIKKSLAKFIKFGSGESDAILLDNSDWLESIKYMGFLRDYGRLFSVNRMLSMESVKARLEREQALTFLEFNYMLLQAYDFYHLNKNYSCSIQFGGSDQWGNIITGCDLVKKITGKEAYGVTTPLLTTSSGIKMGKSVSGAVWINEDLLSPYEYYQYWRNTEDPDVVKFARLYAEFSQEELKKFETLARGDINEAKKFLAFALTKLCHGAEEAERAANTSRNVFELGGSDDNLPSFLLNARFLEDGIGAYKLFFEAGLASSGSEARKLIRGGGAKINDVKIEDENLTVDKSFLQKGHIKLSSGKKKHILVKISTD